MTAKIPDFKEETVSLPPKPSPKGGVGDSSGSSVEPKSLFETDHLLTNLKGRAISSGVVTISAQGLQFGLNAVGIYVLARMLTPHDYGLVAMVAAIVGFLRPLNDGGLSTATLQRDGITHAQVSNLFWTNIALGGLMSVLLVASIPLTTWFYKEPRLIGITLALAFAPLLISSAVQHTALLKRQMRFRTTAVIDVCSMAAGVTTGIVMAYFNYGYWALVGMQLAGPFTVLVMTWVASSWRPQWPARSSGTRSLLGFGANLTASSFLWSLAKGSDAVLIGRFYDADALGLYTRSGALVSRPLDQLVSPIAAVVVPTLSRLQQQPERYRRVFFRVYEATVVSSFLFSGLLLAVAKPLTLVVLGPDWEGAAPIFAASVFVALYIPVASTASWLLTSQGRGSEFLAQSMVGSVLTVVSCLIGLPFGPVGVAASYSAFCLLVALPLTYHIGGRRGPVSTRDLWGRFFTHLPVWIVVCGTTWMVRQFVKNMSSLEQLLICSAVGFLAGVLFVSIYGPSRRAALDVIRGLIEMKKRRGGNIAEA